MASSQYGAEKVPPISAPLQNDLRMSRIACHLLHEHQQTLAVEIGAGVCDHAATGNEFVTAKHKKSKKSFPRKISFFRLCADLRLHWTLFDLCSSLP